MGVGDTNRMRLSNTDGWLSDELHPTQHKRTEAPPDVTMVSISAIELPHGDALDTAVNVDEEELKHDSIIQESEGLWLPSEYPPELATEGKETELASM